MPYGQSPWEQAAGGTSAMGSSMARIAAAQQMGRMRAQQFAQQLAIRQAQEQVQQQRAGIEQQRLDVETPEIQARGRASNASAAKNEQDVGRQSQMDDLARAVAVNMFKQRVPGGTPAVLSGQMTGQPGPTAAGADVLNQGDLVRNAMQLVGMSDPKSLASMMEGKNIPQGDVNYNPMTQDRVEGLPPKPPTGAPIDPNTGMTPYQVQALLLQKSRQADQDKRTVIERQRLQMSPEWQMSHPDETDSGGSGGDASSGDKKKPSRAQAAEYVKRLGSPEAARKQLQTEGFDTSGYAD